MAEDWITIFSSTLAVQVDLIKALLEENQIATVVVNKQDSMQPFLNANIEILLMVQGDEVIRAKRLLENHPI